MPDLLPVLRLRNPLPTLLYTLFTALVLILAGCSQPPALAPENLPLLSVVETVAGTGDFGSDDGPPGQSRFVAPIGMAVDSNGIAYVTDGNRIRRITPPTPANPAGAVTTIAGKGESGFGDGLGSEALFDVPVGLVVDSLGNLFVADRKNYRVRKILPDGTVITLSGNGTAGSTDGPGTAAQFAAPLGMALDPQGNLFLVDADNHRIRKISPDGAVSTFAGSGRAGYVDGPANKAEFLAPWGIAIDNRGFVYVSDSNRIRKILPEGTVSTLAGDGQLGLLNGSALQARFRFPKGLVVDQEGTVYVADEGNNAIRKITPVGLVTTLAGTGSFGFADGRGDLAQFNAPIGIAIDRRNRHLLVADQGNNRIRRVIPRPES